MKPKPDAVTQRHRLKQDSPKTCLPHCNLLLPSYIAFCHEFIEKETRRHSANSENFLRRLLLGPNGHVGPYAPFARGTIFIHGNAPRFGLTLGKTGYLHQPSFLIAHRLKPIS